MECKRRKFSGIEALEVLDLVIRLQNFKDVASVFNISTSTVSVTIRVLRKQYSDILYTRRNKILQPTSLAVMLLGKLEERRRSTQQENETPVKNTKKKNIVVCCEPHNVTNVIPLIMQLNHDAVPISYVTLPPAEEVLVDHLLKQEVDVVFNYHFLAHQDITSRPVYKEKFCIICSKTHPRLSDTVSVEEYYREHHAVIENNSFLVTSESSELEEKVLKRNIAFRSDSILDLFAVVEMSEMLAMISWDTYNKLHTSFGIKLLSYKFTLIPESKNLYINYLKSKKENVSFRNILGLVK